MDLGECNLPSLKRMGGIPFSLKLEGQDWQCIFHAFPLGAGQITHALPLGAGRCRHGILLFTYTSKFGEFCFTQPFLSIFNVKCGNISKSYTKYKKFTQALLAGLRIIPCLLPFIENVEDKRF